jgi:phage/plasmid-associated DNA primase
MVEPEAQVTAGDLYATYENWCKRAGEKPVTKKEFGQRLEERGFVAKRTNADRGWRGIRLRLLTDPPSRP